MSIPYFINCQFLAEGLDKAGKNVQDIISKSTLITTDTKMFNMGEKDTKSAGRCGACKAMGCSKVPKAINDEIFRYQNFQLLNKSHNYFIHVYNRIIIFFENFFGD